jgi:hypothetical protein
VRLANWAADLQKSLAREREQYAALARGERAVWLAERIGECVKEGELVVAGDGGRRGRGGSGGNRGEEGMGGLFEGFSSAIVSASVSPRGRGKGKGRQGRGEKGQFGGHGHGQGQRQDQRHKQDPLGLLEVANELRHKGLVALEVLGGIGVLGGLALWVTRHYLHLQVSGWVVGEWERFWYGPR